MRNSIFTKDGRVSSYGLACGYHEQAFSRPVGDGAAHEAHLYREHNCFHVRLFTIHKGVRTRNVWDSFDKLSEARGRFGELVREHGLTINKEKP